MTTEQNKKMLLFIQTGLACLGDSLGVLTGMLSLIELVIGSRKSADADTLRAQALFSSGLEAIAMNRLDGIQLLEEAHALFKYTGNTEGMALVSAGLGKYCAITSRFDMARRHYRQAHSLFCDLSGKEPEAAQFQQALTLVELGSMELAIGYRLKAERCLKEAKKLYNPHRSLSWGCLGLAKVEIGLGNLHAHKEQYRDALYHYNRSWRYLVKAERKIPGDLGLDEGKEEAEVVKSTADGLVKHGKATVYKCTGDLSLYAGGDSHPGLYRQALDAFLELNDTVGEADVLLAMGDGLGGTRPKQAADHYQRAHDLYRLAGSVAGMATAEWKMGKREMVHCGVDRMDLFWRARMRLGAAIGRAKAVNDKMLEMCALCDLGDLWKKAGMEICPKLPDREFLLHEDAGWPHGEGEFTDRILRAGENTECIEIARGYYSDAATVVRFLGDFTAEVELEWRWAEMDEYQADTSSGRNDCKDCMALSQSALDGYERLRALYRDSYYDHLGDKRYKAMMQIDRRVARRERKLANQTRSSGLLELFLKRAPAAGRG